MFTLPDRQIAAFCNFFANKYMCCWVAMMVQHSHLSKKGSKEIVRWSVGVASLDTPIYTDIYKDKLIAKLIVFSLACSCSLLQLNYL